VTSSIRTQNTSIATESLRSLSISGFICRPLLRKFKSEMPHDLYPSVTKCHTFLGPPLECDILYHNGQRQRKYGNTRQQFVAELLGEELFLLFTCRPTFWIERTFVELVKLASNRDLEISTAPIKSKSWEPAYSH